jgi:hypothetical protein
MGLAGSLFPSVRIRPHPFKRRSPGVKSGTFLFAEVYNI